MLEDRDKAIQEFVRRNPRKGVPNPFIAELWKDDAFYLRVMEARPKTLSPDQVRTIRRLSELGHTITEIAKEVGALEALIARRKLIPMKTSVALFQRKKGT